MSDRPAINPYAPTTTVEPHRPQVVADPEMTEGIEFSGMLDVDVVRATDVASLSAGLFIGGTFAGLLAFSGVLAFFAAQSFSPERGAAIVLLTAALLIAIALVGFVAGQRKRPLHAFGWMAGSVHGSVFPYRIDITWQRGAASMMFPRLISTHDFANRFGRLFVCRDLPCFVPMNSVDAEKWRKLRSFHPSSVQWSGLVASPPEAPQRALCWDHGSDDFVEDFQNHRFVCRRPGASRAIFWLCLLVASLMLVGDLRVGVGLTAVLIAAVVIAGLMWTLREGVRRHWRIRYRTPLPSLSSAAVVRLVPGYGRWMTADQLMIGYSDGWVQLPWSAIASAVVSQHGVELRLIKKSTGMFFLERGKRTDTQWDAVIDRIISSVANTKRWGSVRASGRQ